MGDDARVARARRSLASSPRVGRLRELVLAWNGIGPKGAEALAGSKSLASVETLDLRDNHLGHAGVDALASAEGLPALRRLAITRNQVYTGEIETFEGGSEAAGDGYTTGTRALEETRERLAERFAGRPGLVIS